MLPAPYYFYHSAPAQPESGATVYHCTYHCTLPGAPTSDPAAAGDVVFFHGWSPATPAGDMFQFHLAPPTAQPDLFQWFQWPAIPIERQALLLRHRLEEVTGGWGSAPAVPLALPAQPGQESSADDFF
jgi:hypothetical protein